MCVFLLIYRVSALRRLAHVAGQRLAHTPGPRPQKTQNVWRDVVRPSRCNAFAIARFLVWTYSTVYMPYGIIDLWYYSTVACRLQAHKNRNDSKQFKFDFKFALISLHCSNGLLSAFCGPLLSVLCVQRVSSK